MYKYVKRLLRSGATYQQYAFYCSKTTSVRKLRNKDEKKKMNHDIDNPGQFDEFGNYFPSQEVNLKIKKGSHSFVFQKHVAEKIVKKVLEHRKHPEAPILELNAGPGILSREFLEQGVSRLVAVEQYQTFLTELKALQKELGDKKFLTFHWHMLNLALKLHSQKDGSGVLYRQVELSVIRNLMVASPAKTDVPYSLVCIGGKHDNKDFMFYIYRQIPNEDVIMSNGRVEFFFFTSPKLRKTLDHIESIEERVDGLYPVTIKRRTQPVRFGHGQVIMYLFYDIEFLGEFDRDDFSPPFKAKFGIQSKNIDPNKRLLVKMQLKKDIQNILPLEHHAYFLHFLLQIYKKKTRRIIPTMEMLIPGCGLRLIAEGFTMMDIIFTARPEEFLKIYKLMLHWPEYRSSPLHNYLTMKMTGTIVEEELAD